MTIELGKGFYTLTKISPKQRRNAERELTSKTCAGCGGEKERGFPFCTICTSLLVERGSKTGDFNLLSANLKSTPEYYAVRLEFLLSSKGQKLRTTANA